MPEKKVEKQYPLVEQRAAKGSLRSLLLENAGTRLYVHPLAWTAQHITLLRCRVVCDPALATPTPDFTAAPASASTHKNKNKNKNKTETTTIPLKVLQSLYTATAGRYEMALA
jgi:hypothetical protein